MNKFSNTKIVTIISYRLEQYYDEPSDSPYGVDEEEVDNTFEQIKEKFKAESIDENTLKIILNDTNIHMKLHKTESYCFFRIIVYIKDELDSDNWHSSFLKYSEESDKIIELLPDNHIYKVKVNSFGIFPNKSEAIETIKDFSANKGIMLSAGMICGNHVLARLNEDMDQPYREFLLLPVTSSQDIADRMSTNIFDDLGHFASQMGVIDLLFMKYKSYGDVVEMVVGVAEGHCDEITKKLESSIDFESEMGIGVSKTELKDMELNMADIMIDINNLNSLRNKISSISLSYENSRMFIENIFSKWVETPMDEFSMLTPYERNRIMLEMKGYNIHTERLRNELDKIQQILNTIKTCFEISLNKINERNSDNITLLSLIFACFGIAGFLGEFMSYYGQGIPSAFTTFQGIILFFIITVIPTIFVAIGTYRYFRKKSL